MTGRTYALERTGTLGSHSWDTVVSNLTGTGSVFRVRDTNAAAAGSGFYRINVRLP